MTEKEQVLIQLCLTKLEKAKKSLEENDTSTSLILADESLELFLKDSCLFLGVNDKTTITTSSGKEKAFPRWGFTECMEYLAEFDFMTKDQRSNFFTFHNWRNPVQHYGLQPSLLQSRMVLATIHEFINLKLKSREQNILTTPYLSKFYLTIKEQDPSSEIVEIDPLQKNIKYSKDIIQHRKISNLTQEEIIRAYLIVKLVKELGYSKSSIVLEKPYKIGRKATKKEARLDILIQKNDNSFMLIELEAPDEYDQQLEESIKYQLFPLAHLEDPNRDSLRYLIYYTADMTEGGIRENFQTIDFKKFPTFQQWSDNGKQNPRLIPIEYGIVRRSTYVKGSTTDLNTNVTRKELESIRWNLHNILYGGGKYHTELFFNLLAIFLAKIYDEKSKADDESYEFQIIYKNGDIQSAEEVSEVINKLYRKALHTYLGFSEQEIRQTPDIVFDPPKIKYAVDVLQHISLIDNSYDVLGEFFEKIVWNEFKQTKGQYFTHPNIVKFLLKSLNIDELTVELLNKESRIPYIIDPACGSGTFLIESMKLITNHILNNSENIKKSKSIKEFISSKLPLERKNAWADSFIYGIEINRDLSVATKVNMVMHGDGASNIEAIDGLSSYGVYSKDTLKQVKQNPVYPKPVLEFFDVVVSNPPFSVTIDKETAESLPSNFIWGDDIALKLRNSKKKKEVNVESLFLERWYQLLKPKGRLGVVLPESIFDTTENRKIRLFLYKYFHIKGIVSLPTDAFVPYTPTKTSLLLAQKKTHDEVMEYQKLWEKLETEYDKLNGEIKSILHHKTILKNSNPTQTKHIEKLFKVFLQERFNKSDTSLSLVKLVEKYKDEILNRDKVWWVFSEISRIMNYDFHMAVVEEIGYKRTLRGETKRKNQLFDDDNLNNNNTVLDYFRKKIEWQ